MKSNRAVCILYVSTPHGHEAIQLNGLNEVRAIMMVTVQIIVLWNSGECAAYRIRGQDRGSIKVFYLPTDAQ
jgi:hypothetical protein